MQRPFPMLIYQRKSIFQIIEIIVKLQSIRQKCSQNDMNFPLSLQVILLQHHTLFNPDREKKLYFYFYQYQIQLRKSKQHNKTIKTTQMTTSLKILIDHVVQMSLIKQTFAFDRKYQLCCVTKLKQVIQTNSLHSQYRYILKHTHFYNMNLSFQRG